MSALRLDDLTKEAAPSASIMTKFKFSVKDRVRRIGQQEVRTVEAIHEMSAGEETLYHIQLGLDFATREWAKENTLELVAPAPKSDGGPGFYPPKSIMD